MNTYLQSHGKFQKAKVSNKIYIHPQRFITRNYPNYAEDDQMYPAPTTVLKMQDSEQQQWLDVPELSSETNYNPDSDGAQLIKLCMLK